MHTATRRTLATAEDGGVPTDGGAPWERLDPGTPSGDNLELKFPIFGGALCGLLGHVGCPQRG